MKSDLGLPIFVAVVGEPMEGFQYCRVFEEKKVYIVHNIIVGFVISHLDAASHFSASLFFSTPSFHSIPFHLILYAKDIWNLVHA